MNTVQAVQVIEVGPRDGFQNEKQLIPTQTKLDIIGSLYHAGIRSMEITSFVSPKAVPQMADAGEVAACVVRQHPELRAFALVPNLRGAQSAANAGLREITFVVSASEAHNKANINRTVKESLEELKRIKTKLPELKVRVDIATALGCPFTGAVPIADVLHLIGQATELGAAEIVLCDTIGVANPPQVMRLVAEVREQIGDMPLAMHLHNTRGLGLVNTWVAIKAGIGTFETSVGGLGGCPFAPGAAGNTATEDMLNMLAGMGIATGVDLDIFLEAVRIVSEKIPDKLTSSMLHACKYPLDIASQA